MASRFVLPFADVGSGISPSDGATLDFFDTGTSTRKNTFSNEALTLANANPVIANGDGVFPNIFTPDGGRYKVTLKDKNGVQIFESDPVIGGISALTTAKTFDTVAAMVASIELNTGDLVQTGGRLTKGDGGDNLYEIVAAATGTDDGGSFIDLTGITGQAKCLFSGTTISVKQFGAVGDGVANDTAAIQAAIDFAESFSGDGSRFGDGAAIYIPAGEYKVTSTLNVNATGIYLIGDGNRSSTIVNDGADVNTVKFAPVDSLNQSIFGCGVQNLAFRNISVDPVISSHIFMENCSQCLIHNVNLTDNFRAITIAGSEGTNILNNIYIIAGGSVTSLHPGSSGIYITRSEVASGVGGAVLDSTDGKFYKTANSVYINNTNIRTTQFGQEFNIFVQAADGVYITNTHLGFAEEALIDFDPIQENMPINNISVSNSFLDGFGAVVSKFGIKFDNTAAFASPILRVYDFTGCNINQFLNDGVRIDTNIVGLRFTGGTIKNAGEHGVQIRAGTDISFTNMRIQNSNRLGGTNSHIRIFKGDRIKIDGCILDVGAFAGITTDDSIGTTTKVTVTDTHFEGNTGSTDISFGHADQVEDRVSECTSDKTDVVASTTTISIPLVHDTVSISGTNNIATIDDTPAGGRSSFDHRKATLIVATGFSFVTGGNLRLSGGVNFVAIAGSTITFDYRGGTWFEVGRSV